MPSLYHEEINPQLGNTLIHAKKENLPTERARMPGKKYYDI